jgi:hypothetical protein
MKSVIGIRARPTSMVQELSPSPKRLEHLEKEILKVQTVNPM